MEETAKNFLNCSKHLKNQTKQKKNENHKTHKCQVVQIADKITEGWWTVKKTMSNESN
jgi:hypothetical protein